MKVEKTPQFLIGPAVRYLIFYLLVKSKAKMKLSWKASLGWKDNIHLANEYICDGRLTRLREYGWDFSHLDNIIETLLNRMPNHDVYIRQC